MADDPHKRQIQDNKAFLVENLDLTKTLVLDQLVEKGVLSQLKLMSIQEICATNNLQLSRAVLDHLYGRPYTDWCKFLTCLTECGQQHIVEHLQSTHRAGHSGLSVVRLQHKMSDIILQLYDKIPLWTLHSDLCWVPLEVTYVDIVLVEDKQRTLGKEEHLQGYMDIFRKSGQRSTIYLRGEPGVGKSTFTQYLCVEWAKVDHKAPGAEKQTGDMDYQFVLPLFLRDVKQGQGLCDLMAEEYHLRRREAEELYHYIRNTEEPVLIIADGLDDYSESTSQEITKMLYRQILPHITLVITSRFSPETFAAEGKLRPDSEVSLRGFSEAGVKEYLLKFFNQNEGKRDTLLNEIQESEELVHFSHYPAVLLMMATVWEERQQLPSTITCFYGEFVAYAFARMEKKKQKMTGRSKSTKDILKRYIPQVMALGFLATGNVKTHKLELKFQPEEVDKHISPESLKAGLLIEKQSLSRKRFYMFIHKTVQEFCLAFYIVNVDMSKQKELLFRFCNSRHAFHESSMIRRFVAGLGGEFVQKEIITCLVGTKREVAYMQTELQLEYLAEHPLATFTLPRVAYLEITDKYPTIHFVRWMSQSGWEMKEMFMRSYDERPWHLLHYLHAPQLICLDLDASNFWLSRSFDTDFHTAALEKTITKFPLKQLRVSNLCEEKEASAVFCAISQMMQLQDLEFSSTPLSDDHIQTLSKWLPKSNLTSLNIFRCDLKLQDMMTTFHVLPQSLHTLRIIDNSLTGLADERYLAAVTNLRLQRLYMTYCRLTPRDMLAVIDTVPDTLTYLNLGGNCKEGGDDLVRVKERTTRLKTLKGLNFSSNEISTDVADDIKKELRDKCPQLKLVMDWEFDNIIEDSVNIPALLKWIIKEENKLADIANDKPVVADTENDKPILADRTIYKPVPIDIVRDDQVMADTERDDQVLADTDRDDPVLYDTDDPVLADDGSDVSELSMELFLVISILILVVSIVLGVYNGIMILQNA